LIVERKETGFSRFVFFFFFFLRFEVLRWFVGMKHTRRWAVGNGIELPDPTWEARWSGAHLPERP